MIPISETLRLSSLIGSSMQMSYVVPDLEAALAFWTENLGVGPFVVIENAADDRYVFYRESKTTVKMSLAFSYVGEMQIELVHASADEPTSWPRVGRGSTTWGFGRKTSSAPARRWKQRASRPRVGYRPTKGKSARGISAARRIWGLSSNWRLTLPPETATSAVSRR